jgi:branched-chain amino acid transport system ATP-binding protein
MPLAPIIVSRVFEIIQELKAEGKTIFLVEQMAHPALGIADRGYVLETGRVTVEVIGREAYLGA